MVLSVTLSGSPPKCSEEPADPQRGGAPRQAEGGEGEGVEGQAARARQAEEGATGRGNIKTCYKVI
jgi:hypothetical protein